MCLLSPANHTIFCTIGRENCNVFSLWLLYTIFRILLSTFSLFFILFSKIRQFCCYFFHPKSFKILYLLYIIYNLFFFSVFYFIHSISCQNSTSCMQLNCSFCTTFQVQISIKAYFLAHMDNPHTFFQKTQRSRRIDASFYHQCDSSSILSYYHFCLQNSEFRFTKPWRTNGL